MTPKRKDSNHKSIVAALNRVGALWIDTTGDPTIGFDGLIAYAGKLHIAEIKDGSKAPSARKLTEGELKRQVDLAYKKVPYNIIESEEDALRLIGVIQ